jgi:hypothetical protein
MKMEKRSVRLYPRIFPLYKGVQKNPGITAIERSFCLRSIAVFTCISSSQRHNITSKQDRKTHFSGPIFVGFGFL